MTDKEIRALIEKRRKDWKYGNSVEAKYKAEECKDILELIDSLQEESTFKVGDRIRIKGTTVKGDVIKNIYQAEGGNTYFEFENSDDALANEMWELVEEHKEFKPIRKKHPEGVLKELLDNMDEKELEDTRKEMLQEEPVSEELEEEVIKKVLYFGENFHKTPWAIDSTGTVMPIWYAKFGANWQKEQDKETIELAEDHAMLAGMEKMKEQMIAKTVETTFNVSLPSVLYDKLWIKGCKEGDKLLVIKKDEL